MSPAEQNVMMRILPRRRIARSLVSAIVVGLVQLANPQYTFALPATQNSGSENILVGSTGCQSDVTNPTYVETLTTNGDCVVIMKYGGSGNSTTHGWTAPTNVTEVSFLLVAGGGSGGSGGGGSNEAGGGGAGGLILARKSVTPGTAYSFTVGKGGAGNSTGGNNGENSTAFGYTANGGGRGGGSTGSTTLTPSSGGSGGGGGHNKNGYGIGNQYSSTGFGRGFDGGVPSTPSSGAGGGGAGGKGGTTSGPDANSAYSGGNGGAGFASSISGSEKYYAGGGGGNGSWSNNTQIFGTGGSSVGGNGDGSSAVANTGSGGGGQLGNQSKDSRGNGVGGDGAAGILIIRWTPTGYTNSLKMYVRSQAGATSATTFTDAGKFTTSCSNTEDTFPYAGVTSAKHDWGGDAAGGGPAGCQAETFTVYATGWIKAPAASFKLYTKSDDGSRIDINGTTYVNYTADQGPNLQPQAGIETNTSLISGLTAGSWYRIDTWMHENGGGAAHEMLWSLDNGLTQVTIPATSLTYRFPSTIKSAAIDTVTAVRVPTNISVALDTTTVKVYNNTGSALLTQSGTFGISDSGTAPGTCTSFSRSAQGTGLCAWQPLNADTRTVIFTFTSTDTSGVNGAALFLSSTSSAQTSDQVSIYISPIFVNADTDTAINVASDRGYAWAADAAELEISGSITMAAWVKPTGFATGDWNTIINKGLSYELGIVSSDGVTGYYAYGFSGYSGAALKEWSGVITNIKAKVDEWHHVAVTRETATASAKLYLDGNLVYTGTADSATTGSIYNSTYPLVVGARSTNGTTFITPFAGQIDHVQVWDIARTKSNIESDMHTYTTTNTSGLRLFYDFNERSGSTVYNKVSSAVVATDLTLIGSPTWSDVKTVDTTTASIFTIVKFPRTYLTRQDKGWFVPTDAGEFRVFVVGGGGGGGFNGGGGGGGSAGMVWNSSQTGRGYKKVVVGQGGSGSIGSTSNYYPDVLNATNGQTSFFGDNYNTNPGYAGTDSMTTSSVAGYSVGGQTNYSSLTGGRGGNGANNANAGVGQAGDGANGFSGTIEASTKNYGAGGGGGGTNSTGGAGGTGGGGAGGSGVTAAGTNGTANTGSGGGGSAGRAFGGNGGSGLIVVRWFNITKPIYTQPTNTAITLGQSETFSVNMMTDSATAFVTRTFTWESSTTGANGTFSTIKTGTGLTNTYFTWKPTDTSTSGSNYRFRVKVVDQDAYSLSISDTSSSVFATISTGMLLTYKSTITKTIGVSKTEVMTFSGGAAPFTFTLTPVSTFFTMDTATVTSPRLVIADTATIGTYYETLTVTDSNSATLIAPLTIIISSPPTLANSAALVDSGTVISLDAAHTASYPKSGSTWSDLSGSGYNADMTYAFGTTQKMVDGTSRTSGMTYLNSTTCTKPTYSASTNGVFEFNGVDNCGYIPNVGLIERYTVELWVKRNGSQTSGYSTLIANPYRTAGDELNINITYRSGNTIGAEILYGGVSKQAISGATADNTWVHVCVIYDGTDLKIMLNNNSAAITSIAANAVSWNKSKVSSGLLIGNYMAGSTNNIFKGSLGGIRVYNRALTLAEITQNYNASKGRYLNSANFISISKKWGATYSDTYTVSAGSETLTAAFASTNSLISWDTSTAKSLKLTLQPTLAVGTYLETVTVTDIYGASSYWPLTIVISAGDSLTVSVETATVLTYTGRAALTYPKVVIKGLSGTDSATVQTSFTSLTYTDSLTVPTNADTYTVRGTNLTFTSGSLSNYAAVIYETSTLTITRAMQTPLNIFLYGGVVGSPFAIIPQGGSGTGAITETLTGVSNIPGCAISNHVLYSTTTYQGYCEVRVVKAQDQNYFAETATAQMYFMKYILDQPIGLGGGPTIGLSGRTDLTIDDTTTAIAPMITGFTLSGSTLTITGFGFGSSPVTVQFYRYVNAAINPTPTNSGRTIQVAVPAEAISGPVIVITATGIAATDEVTLP